MFDLIVTIPAALLATYVGATYLSGGNFEVIDANLPEETIKLGYSEKMIIDRVEERFGTLDRIHDAVLLGKEFGYRQVTPQTQVSSFFSGLSNAFHEFEQIRLTSAYMGLIPNAVSVDIISVDDDNYAVSINDAAQLAGSKFAGVTVTRKNDDLTGAIDHAVDRFLYKNYPLEYFVISLSHVAEESLAQDAPVSADDARMLRGVLSDLLAKSSPREQYFLYNALAVMELFEGHFNEGKIKSQQAATLVAKNDVKIVLSGIIEAWALELMGDLEQAEAKYNEIVTSFPSSSPGYMFYGNFQKRLGRADEAEENFTKGVKLDPNKPRYLALLADMKQHSGDYVSAAKLFKDAYLLDKSNKLIEKRLKISQSMLDPSLAAFHDEESIETDRTICLFSKIECVLMNEQVRPDNN